MIGVELRSIRGLVKVGHGTIVLIGNATMNYPADLATNIETENGIPLSIRPIRPDDAELLTRFHERLSSQSIYRRYFSLHPVLSDSELRHLTEVDYITRFAFVVVYHGELIGVGRFDRIPATNDAEVAFIVSDEYHHLGIGLMLLHRLADVAWSLGSRDSVRRPRPTIEACWGSSQLRVSRSMHEWKMRSFRRTSPSSQRPPAGRAGRDTSEYRTR